jgi:N-acetylneuraminate lyase
MRDEMPRIEGILPALITPMDAKGKLRPDVLKSMVDWLFDQGVHGLYTCGTSGEGLLLSTEERQEILDEVVKATAGRGKIIAHIGAVGTEEAVRLAKHAADAGAHAVAAVPPFTFGRSDEGMRSHYQAIVEATGLPLYLYNIPSLTAVHVTADMVRPLLDLPNIRGMKFSDYNLFAEFQIISLGKDFHVFHGCDETLLYALMMGAIGGIGLTYNFMPKLFVDIFNAHKAGDWKKANELQLKASQIINVFLKHSHMNAVGLAKSLMGLLGFDCGQARPPNPPVSASRIAALKEDLQAVAFFDFAIAK